ncbi:hypothetical protein V7D15_07110 [Thermoanaerobacter thermohydrosulfuricus]
MLRKAKKILKDERGFHLLELLIGIGIVGAIGVIIYVALQNFAPDFMNNLLQSIKNAIHI